MLFFSRLPGTATAHTLKFVGVQKLVFACIGLFGDYEGRDFKKCLQYRAQLDMRFRPSGS